MSVRKRSWITDRGEAREAWVVDYSQLGHRHLKTFARKRDAEFHQEARYGKWSEPANRPHGRPFNDFRVS